MDGLDKEKVKGKEIDKQENLKEEAPVRQEEGKKAKEKEMSLLRKILKAFKSLKWYEILMCLIMLGISIYYAILPQEGTPRWLAIINFVSGLCGIICVFFCAKANRMNFPFAVVNTTVFMIYLWYFGIWATFWLEAIVYFPMNIISWVNWYKHKDEEDKLLAKSKRLLWWQNLLVTGFIIALTVVVHYALSFWAGNTWMKFADQFGWNVTFMKWLDSAIFAIGIVAVVLEALRYKEQYVWWLITDVIAVAQYVLKKDPVYVTKKGIYLVEAIVGIRNWTHLAKKNARNE
ncbi:MAG: nicotinamide mononucleotide transporter [Clostridiales bacterium]|nr:nicotinamide mononucleotide transporter [Clostridiales bacterium]